MSAFLRKFLGKENYEIAKIAFICVKRSAIMRKNKEIFL